MLEVLRFFQGAYERAGSFTRENGKVSFRYDNEYLKNTHAHALSISLPLRAEPYEPFEFQGFFEGLVPEGKTRTELARRMGVSPSDWLSLLESLNCECIGALVFKRETVSLAEYESSLIPFPIKRFDTLADAPSLSAAEAAEASRLSLSGAQAKLGLFHLGDDPQDGWFTPRGLAPSTHIVKVPDENHPYLALNEYICMKAAATCRVTVADCFTLPSKRPLFVTRRFDRPLPERAPIDGPTFPIRLHQEDFCQAAGFPSYGKYEMEPTDNYAASASRTIERFSSNAIADKIGFTRQIIFDYLVGNCDNHLKNYSLQYSEDWNRRSLAPAYDLVSTTVLGYSRLMGISIGDTRDIDAVTRNEWKLFAQDLRMPQALVLDELDAMRESVTGALLEAAGSALFDEAKEIAEAIVRDMQPRLTA